MDALRTSSETVLEERTREETRGNKAGAQLKKKQCGTSNPLMCDAITNGGFQIMSLIQAKNYAMGVGVVW